MTKLKALKALLSPYHKAIAAFLAPLFMEFAIEVQSRGLNARELAWAAAKGVVYAGMVYLSPANDQPLPSPTPFKAPTLDIAA